MIIKHILISLFPLITLLSSFSINYILNPEEFFNYFNQYYYYKSTKDFYILLFICTLLLFSLLFPLVYFILKKWKEKEDSNGIVIPKKPRSTITWLGKKDVDTPSRSPPAVLRLSAEKSDNKPIKKLPIPKLGLSSSTPKPAIKKLQLQSGFKSDTHMLDQIANDPITSRYIKVDFEPSEELLKEYPFYAKDTKENIIFEINERKFVIECGTFNKLVEKLTSEQRQDPQYIRAFLLTYRSFATTKEVLEALRIRWKVPIPEGLKSHEETAFENGARRQIRFRIWFVLKEWISNHWEDFEGNEELINDLKSIVDEMSKNERMANPAKQISNLIEQKRTRVTSKRIVVKSKLPSPILPRNMNDINWTTVSPTELARQLVMIEFEMYAKIKAYECLDQKWTKGDGKKAPNIMEMVNRFNRVSRCVVTTILSEPDLKKRSKILKIFIDIALACKVIANFNGMMEIVSGLLNASIQRLKKTWAYLPEKSREEFSQFEMIMFRNFKQLRDFLSHANPPVLPYIGVYMGDLTFIYEGNGDFSNNGLINFYKRTLISNVILQIQQFQQKPYRYEIVPEIRNFLFNLPSSEELFDDNKAYKLSLEYEPRGSS